MISLLFDYLMSLAANYPTFLILLNILIIKKENIGYIILIGLVLDLLILDTKFLNTIILVLIFLIYKKLNIRVINLKNYLISFSIIYLLFIFGLCLVNNSLNLYLSFVLKNYWLNLLIFLICYKLAYKYIKLSR